MGCGWLKKCGGCLLCSLNNDEGKCLWAKLTGWMNGKWIVGKKTGKEGWVRLLNDRSIELRQSCSCSVPLCAMRTKQG